MTVDDLIAILKTLDGRRKVMFATYELNTSVEMTTDCIALEKVTFAGNAGVYINLSNWEK